MGGIKSKFKLKFKKLTKMEKEKTLNPKIVYSILIVTALIIGYLVQFSFYRPNFGTFLSSDMDPAGNVYVLGVNTNNGKYRITKITSRGSAQFQIDLDKSTDKIENTYRYIQSDSKGNFYVVKEQRNTDAVVSDKSQYPITKESVLMYDTDGNYIKEIASADFSKEATPPTTPYIRKLQVVGQKITLVGARDNTYEVITADPLKDESPVTVKSFDITPTVAQTNKNVDWVNDIAVLSNGRVIYSTKSGKFYAMDNQGSFLDYSDVISGDSMLISGLSVDTSDNLYFTDIMSGNFYKMNTRSLSASKVYNLENDIVQSKNIKVKDLRTIKVIAEDDYYAASKDFTNPYHVRFGSTALLIDNITGGFWPWGLVIMIGVALLVLGLYFLGRAAINYNIKRIPLAVRITGLFLPVFVVAMGVLLFIIANDASKDYSNVLKNDQDTGAKIAADHINGDLFSTVDHTGDYMNTDYITLKNSLCDAYNDIAAKIGDRSDYIVTYIVKDSKIYSTFSNKYSTESKSYDHLKYTNPDMIQTEIFLVDCVLERDENESLYNTWKDLSGGETDIERVEFRDVYGNLSASFAPIKNSEGKVVGFIGNFVDDTIHKVSQFKKIIGHSASIVLITAFVIIVYMCLVVKYSLRPIKTLEKSINAMSKGIWNTRVRVTSKDEFADIAEAFNLMSEKMDRYTSNLILLNDKYVKFVPSEIFKLIGKDKITQVHLHDYKTITMNVLYLTFNLSCRDAFNFKSEKEMFDALNTSYESFFGVVEKNSGVVHSFGSLGATILFPKASQDAFNASVQFKEIFINDQIKKHMNMTLGSGEVLIGISGNKKRRGVVVVSDQLMQLFNIDSHLSSLKINHVATENIIKNLPQNGICNYRFIGKVSGIQGGESSVKLYEMIDMTNRYKKDLYISTKELFEKAVDVYTSGEFEEARKLFSDVLKVNNKDSVAVNYLMKCDEQINATDDSFNRKKWTGNLFD